MNFSKAIRFLSILLIIHPIAAGPVSSDVPDDTLGTSKRAFDDLPVYPYEFGVTNLTKGVQGPFYFEQLRDHHIPDPERFTFPQRYWVNDDYYVRDHGGTHPGPIFLIISDQEVDKNMNLLGKNREFDSRFLRMAQRYHGMLVVLEHRYFGESYPVNDLSEKNLEFLTVRQALGDVQHFAFTGMGHGDLRARTMPTKLHRKFVPWVLIGGGYTGPLVLVRASDEESGSRYSFRWTRALGNEAKEKFDAALLGWLLLFRDDSSEGGSLGILGRDLANNATRLCERCCGESSKRLGLELGLSQIKHADDIAQILSRAIDYATSRSRVDTFCDALESDEHGNIPEDGEGRGLSWALEAWRIYNEEKYLKDSDSKWSSHDMTKSKYTDLKPRAVSLRVSKWLRCNELGWFKTAPDPKEVDKLVVSKLLNVDRERDICRQIFPRRYKDKRSSPSVDEINTIFGGGSNGPAARVFYFNGGMDPNLSMTLPPDNTTGTGEIQKFVENAAHMGDFKTPLGKSKSMDKATSVGVAQMGNWLDEWYLEIAMGGLKVGDQK